LFLVLLVLRLSTYGGHPTKFDDRGPSAPESVARQDEGQVEDARPQYPTSRRQAAGALAR
jgi:hypothetical protein